MALFIGLLYNYLRKEGERNVKKEFARAGSEGKYQKGKRKKGMDETDQK